MGLGTRGRAALFFIQCNIVSVAAQLLKCCITVLGKLHRNFSGIILGQWNVEILCVAVSQMLQSSVATQFSEFAVRLLFGKV